MKLAHRQKFSGKARTSFQRDRQARWWMEESVEEYLDPQGHDSHGTHVAPVVRGAAVLAEVGAMDRSGEYASLESVDMDRAGFSLRPAVDSHAAASRGDGGENVTRAMDESATWADDDDATCALDEGATRAAEARQAAAVCRASQASVDLLPKAEGPPLFSWGRFAVGCMIGTAAALGALFILSSIVR
ncbi:MAG: hypothetical protein IT449_12135 [Phycisphaerales bacterium]|nr:hypothetical protein [Phycisphaerales bacterium]